MLKKWKQVKRLSENQGLKKVNRGRNYYRYMMFMLLFPTFMSVYYYGFRILIVLAAAALSGILTETVMCFIMRRRPRIRDYHSAYTGLIIALMLPASASPWLAVLGTVFAIAVAKIPFGGSFRSPFVPACVGFAFICVCRPDQVFAYPPVGILTDTTQSNAVSLAAGLSAGNSSKLNISILFTHLVGNFPGPMGTTCAVVLIACLIGVLIKYPKNIFNTIGFLGSCAIIAAIFPRVLTGIMLSISLELSAGMLLFASIFLITDPASSPIRMTSRLLYGITGGVICMLFRHFGTYEEGVCFAILITNAVWPVIESFSKEKIPFLSKRALDKPLKKEAVVNG